MNDLVQFERLIADVAAEAAGPARPVDVAAITHAATTQSPKWRVQPMLSATKFVIAGAIVALFGGFLLAGVMMGPSDDSAPGAAASPSAIVEETAAPGPHWFDIKITGYAVGQPPAMSHGIEGHGDAGPVTVTGLALEEREPWRRADERALGSVTEIWTWYAGVAPGGTDAMVGRGSTRIENDGGAWVGTARRYSMGDGVEQGTAVWELVGEGGYEGLTLFLWGQFGETPDIGLTGTIVASGSVPDFPPPPSDVPDE